MKSVSYFTVFPVLFCINSACQNEKWKLMTVAVNKNVQENQILLEGIQDLLTNVSKLAFFETRGRLYLEKITIEVPSTVYDWTQRPNRLVGSRYSTADIRIASPEDSFTINPDGVKKRKCEGSSINLSPGFIMNAHLSQNSERVLLDQLMTKHDASDEYLTTTHVELGFDERRDNAAVKDKELISEFSSRDQWLPKFHIVQSGEAPRCVLILDTSGSMMVVGNITDGARFLLISDGDENIPCQGPCIDDIWQDLQNSGVIIDTVALGVEASSRLEEMSSKTGGNSHYIPCDPQRTTEQFDKPFFYFSQKIKSDLDQPEVMLPNVERLVGGDWESFDVLIDSSIGRNTRFIFITSMVEDLEVELSSPELKYFGLSDSHWHISPEEMIVFDFPNAEAGLWRVNLRFRKGSDRVLTVVRSEPRNFTSQIISVDTWTENDIRDNQDVVVIKAKVSTNKEPLEGVAVDALVTTPNGERMKLEMIETEEIGEYEVIFGNFTGTGRYGFEINVRSDSYQGHHVTEKLNRVSSGGVFKVMQPALSLRNPADGLHLVRQWREKESDYLELEWTFPARSSSATPGCFVDLRINRGLAEHQENFERWRKIEEPDLITGSLKCMDEFKKQRVVVPVKISGHSVDHIVQVSLRIVNGEGLDGVKWKTLHVTIHRHQGSPHLVMSVIWLTALILLCMLLLCTMIYKKYLYTFLKTIKSSKNTDDWYKTKIILDTDEEGPTTLLKIHLPI